MKRDGLKRVFSSPAIVGFASEGISDLKLEFSFLAFGLHKWEILRLELITGGDEGGGRVAANPFWGLGGVCVNDLQSIKQGGNGGDGAGVCHALRVVQWRAYGKKCRFSPHVNGVSIVDPRAGGDVWACHLCLLGEVSGWRKGKVEGRLERR